MSQRATRIPSREARQRILAAARELLSDRPFAAVTVGDVMDRAGLTRTVFYRHFDDLAQMAPDLLPDEQDPLVDQVQRLVDKSSGSSTSPALAPEDLIEAMVVGQVTLYAEHGPLLRAIDAAAPAGGDGGAHRALAAATGALTVGRRAAPR
jgi:TetR/AcrR family transcriptional regulator, ethionamide resistance regulator